jgi:acetyltransferase-like isoleucine patch superfamily enzyme
MECDNSVLEIGASTTAESSIFHFAENSTSIRVGEDCMFARETFFLASDFHSVVDQTTGVRLNGARGIDLENHVWVGLGAKVLKNVRIGTGAVIATSSVVTRNVAPHTIVMGVPAKEIKSGIKWVRERV